MIKKPHFVNKLRDLGFTFIRQADRVDLYRQKGSGKMTTVPRRDLIPETQARMTLEQLGCGQSEIDAFISAAKA